MTQLRETCPECGSHWFRMYGEHKNDILECKQCEHHAPRREFLILSDFFDSIEVKLLAAETSAKSWEVAAQGLESQLWDARKALAVAEEKAKAAEDETEWRVSILISLVEWAERRWKGGDQGLIAAIDPKVRKEYAELLARAEKAEAELSAMRSGCFHSVTELGCVAGENRNLKAELASLRPVPPAPAEVEEALRAADDEPCGCIEGQKCFVEYMATLARHARTLAAELAREKAHTETVKRVAGRVVKGHEEALDAARKELAEARAERDAWMKPNIRRENDLRNALDASCPDPEAHEKGDLLLPCDHPAPTEAAPKECDECGGTRLEPGADNWEPCPKCAPASDAGKEGK